MMAMRPEGLLQVADWHASESDAFSWHEQVDRAFRRRGRFSLERRVLKKIPARTQRPVPEPEPERIAA